MTLVLYEQQERVTTLTLNRPERHNALIPELLDDLLAVLELVVQDMECRAVILAAKGRSFSTGGDGAGFIAHDDDIEAYAYRLVGRLNEIIMALIDLPMPVISAVQGLVTGGSFGLLLASDIILMAPEVIVQPFYSDIGPSPDGGWTALLPDLIGQKKAAHLLYLNEPLSAHEALSLGLVNRLVPAEQLMEEARLLAFRIAGKKAGSIQRTKRLLWGNRPEIEARLAAEMAHFAAQIITTESRRGWVDHSKGLKNRR